MTVVYRASVPIYETECDECHSVIRYRKAEARYNQGYINCPVCGVTIPALTVNPVTVLDDEEKKKCDTSNADRIRSKSDEELAEFFGTLPCCPPGEDVDELCYPLDSCEGTDLQVKCWLEWLRKEADNGEVREVFENVPAADVVEVRHGKWNEAEHGKNSVLCECSICKKWMLFYYGFDANFCPNCGADMR